MSSTTPASRQPVDTRAILEALRSQPPLVQCITNYVSMDLAANLLNAAGASPAMVHDPHEAAELASLASAVCINIGTPSPSWVEGMHAAASRADERSIPWVLDPVAVGATDYRREIVEGLWQHRPTVVRGNASEILSLATSVGAGRGVDATDESTAVVEPARVLAAERGTVVVVSGAVDVVTDGDRVVEVHGGDPRMPMISALGCSASALVAACCAAATTTPDGLALDGAATAMAALAVAGERAGERAEGPGTLRPQLLDALAALDPAETGVGLAVREDSPAPPVAPS